MTYVALIRGIGPTHPNMRSEKLIWAFERMGFTNVKTVIASGNVVFDSPEKSPIELEKTIEEHLPKLLGFSRIAIVRSKDEIASLIKKDPFKDINNKLYLNVSFLKKDITKDLPANGLGYEFIGHTDREFFFFVDTTTAKSPDVMNILDKMYKKEVTTRTWKTVNRIIAKMA